MEIERKWAMPNKNTFSIPPITKLIEEYLTAYQGAAICDHFVGNSVFKSMCTVTNDINSEIDSDYTLDAVDFIENHLKQKQHIFLLDTPYSHRQATEHYKGKTVKSIFRLYEATKKVIKPGGIVITFGWNSNGLGKKRGFEIVKILLVAHGSSHNDTIVTVEEFTHEHC